MDENNAEPCTIHIRRNSDGLVRVCCPDMLFDGDSIWSDGNFSCDCNRSLFFARSAGEEDPEIQCGDTAYSVQITGNGGKILYQDDYWNENMDMDEVKPINSPTLKDYLASEVTQTRVLIAIKAALDSIGARKRLGSAISNEKAATVLTAVVLEALAPQLPPDGPGGGEEVPSEEVKAA